MDATFRKQIKQNQSTILSTFLYIIFFVSVLYFIALPVLSLACHGFFKTQSLDELILIFKKANSHLLNSMRLSVPVTLLSTIFATIMSFVLWRYHFFGRKLLRVLVWIPLLNPPFVGSLSFIMLFGKRGLITHELLGLNISPYGYYGVFAMQVIGLTTLGYLVISRGIKNTQVSYEAAARTMGISEFKILKDITFPLLKPDILNGMLLIFLASMADFTTPLIIGGPFQTLSSNLYIQITGLYDLKTASIYGVLLLVPCLIVFLIQKKYLSQKKYWDSKLNQEDIEYIKVSKVVKWPLIAITCLITSFYILKIGFIIIGAFTEHWGYDYTLTLTHFKNLNNREWTPFINSVKLSLGVGLISSFLGILSAYWINQQKHRGHKLLDSFITLPAAVPGILFGIGYLVTFKYPIFGVGRFWLTSFKGILLMGTSSIVYIICIYRYMNIGLRTGTALLSHQNPDLEKAAYTLGASKIKTFFTVSLPLLMPAYEVTFMKVFSSTMTTLGAIIFLLLPINKVAVQQIFQIITSSDRGLASAMALSLSMVMLIVMALFKVIIQFREWFMIRRL